MHKQLEIHLQFLSVLGNLTEHPLVQRYRAVLDALRSDDTAFGWEYGALCDTVYRTGDLHGALLDAVRRDENALNANLPAPPQHILDAATHDLGVLNGLLALSGDALLADAREAFPGTADCLTGTGKSSTVKAVVNEYAPRGLKIVELPPKQVKLFPRLCERIAASPFRFIVFLDDLSFDQEDENFAALKAFIEGGLAGRPENLVIYATSNRRHLVRESFSSRQGDDIHLRDTLETATSLSDRFGLEITFSVPDKDEYLYIVDELAAEYGVTLPAEELHLLAERFALRRNGRSPRTARQFISQHLAELHHA